MRPFDELAAKARDPKALTFERKSAIQELGRQGDARAAGVLGELLADREVSIRREAVNALGRVRGAEATRLLVGALADTDHSCVKAALVGLGTRNDPAAAPALRKLVETGDLSARIEAKRLLRQLGAEADEPPPEPAPEPAPVAEPEVALEPEAPSEPEAPVVEEPSVPPPAPPREPAPPKPPEPPAEAPVAPVARGPSVPPPPPPPPEPAPPVAPRAPEPVEAEEPDGWFSPSDEPAKMRPFLWERQRAKRRTYSVSDFFGKTPDARKRQERGCGTAFAVVVGLFVLLSLLRACSGP